MKIKGFRLGKRLSRWVACRTRKPSWGSKLISWSRRFTKSLCNRKTIGSGYQPLRDHEDHAKKVNVPKGHLAVYVGHEDGAYYRVMVPVIYFNHPLFGQLLKEAEEEYGFDHQGGITIPCRISDFETVKTKIAAGH